jgi:hypothetical protein
MQYAWTCGCCGKQFDTLPLDIAWPAPLYWYTIPEDERARRADLTEDLCAIDNEDFFVRGVLEIPVIGLDEKFCWGVWSSVSRASVNRIIALWEEPMVENEPPCPGWLSSAITIYPDTWHLKTLAHLRGVALRPRIELMEADHPLYREQQEGITVERVLEIIQQMGPKH